jgi:cyclophilin family peptidyl-prolyl cis-trans isomerase
MVSLRRTAWILAALVFALAGCGGGGASEQATTAATVTATTTTSTSNERQPLDPAKVYSIVFETNQGTFHVELDQKQSPNVAASMYALARKGFFDGTICHRIVPGFVIQCGDPTGTGTGGPGYSTQDKVPADASYTKGVVAMAKTQTEPPGTAGSQFFVVTGEDVGLPPEYAILGKVTDGLDVIEKIGALGDPATEQPTERVEIKHAEATEAG